MQNPISETEVVIPLRLANIYSFVIFLLALLLFGGAFSFVWTWDAFVVSWKSFLTNYWSLIIALFSGMFIHELLHATVWAMFCKDGFQSITFGINWSHLAPFVHCREWLPKRYYVAGVIMPGLILGIIPSLVALTVGHGWLLCFGIFFTAGAAADFLSIAKLIQVKKSVQVRDHQEHLGFWLRENNNLRFQVPEKRK
jgi:hypothetical protein